MDLVSDDLGVEVALFWYGGSRALDKIASAADDVFGPRRTLSHVDKALVVSQALARRGAGLVSRL